MFLHAEMHCHPPIDARSGEDFGGRITPLITSGSYDLARQEVFIVGAVYATRTAAVFMTTTSTVLMQTRIVPRWVAILGYTLALVLLLSASYKIWLALAFPLWVILVSNWMIRSSVRKL